MIGTGMPGASFTDDFAETFVSPSGVDLRDVRRWLSRVDERRRRDVREDVHDDRAADGRAAARGRAGERDVLDPDRVLRHRRRCRRSRSGGAPFATDASVWKKTTSTPIDAETLAPPFLFEVPALPARPQTIRSFSLSPVLTASTVIPLPVTTASWPIVALFVMLAKLTPTAAATWVPSPLVARPVDFALSSAQVLGADLHLAARAGDVRVVADLRLVGRHDPVEADRRRDADAAAVRVAALRAGLAVPGVGAAVRAVAVLRGRQRAGSLVVRVRVVVDLVLLLLVGVVVAAVGALRGRVGVGLARSSRCRR